MTKFEKTKLLSSKAITRQENTDKIIIAAEEVFSVKGFEGATTREIAQVAGLPKANLHYYFPTKEILYIRVLEDILEEWIDDAEIFDSDDDPETVFRAYIARKIEHSFTRPYGSKVWAMEIISGGQIFDRYLKDSLLKWNTRKIHQISSWIDAGKLRPVNPQYLLYAIWATTQHYADFEYQIKALNRGRPLSRKQTDEVVESIVQIVLRGVLPGAND